MATLTGRVRQRQTGEGLDRYLERTVELATQMDRDRLEDLVLETDGRGVAELARTILDHRGWLTPSPG